MKLKKTIDRNGNSILRVSPRRGRGFSVQTNGNLPFTHRTPAEDVESHIDTIAAELRAFLAVHGTRRQRNLVA